MSNSSSECAIGDSRDQRTPAFLFSSAPVNWSGLARIVHSDHLVLVVIPGVHEKGMALPAFRRYIQNRSYSSI
jgi:hypothetical protein